MEMALLALDVLLLGAGSRHPPSLRRKSWNRRRWTGQSRRARSAAPSITTSTGTVVAGPRGYLATNNTAGTSRVPGCRDSPASIRSRAFRPPTLRPSRRTKSSPTARKPGANHRRL